MNSWDDFYKSKYNDALIVDFFKRHRKEAYVCDNVTDMKNKVDIALKLKNGKICNIDTKYVNREESNVL